MTEQRRQFTGFILFVVCTACVFVGLSVVSFRRQDRPMNTVNERTNAVTNAAPERL